MKTYPTLRDLLSDLFPEKTIKNVEEKQSKDAMASTRGNLTIVFEDLSEIKLFLKIRRAGSATESLHKKYGLFEKEILMYGTVVPELDEMLRKSQKTETQKYDLSEMFPKFYGAGFINHDLFLFFEDIVSDSKSFVTGDKDFHSKEQVTKTLEHLALFHAASFLFQRKSGENFLEKHPSLDEPVYHPSKVDGIRPYFQGYFIRNLKIIRSIIGAFTSNNSIAKSKLKKVPKLEEIEKLLEIGSQLMERVFELLKPEIETQVIAHGDFHMWNVAFVKQNYPDKVLFFDLQTSRVTSGVADIIQYLYQVSSPDNDHMEESQLKSYFAKYCQKFRDVLETCGLNADGEKACSEEWVAQEWDRLTLFGLMFAVDWILPRFVENKEIFNQVTEDILQNDEPKVVELFDKSGSEIWKALQIVMDIIETRSTKV